MPDLFFNALRYYNCIYLCSTIQFPFMVLQKRYRYPWHWELDDAISSERSSGVGVADVKLTRGVTDVAASIGGCGVVAHWVPDNATSSAIVGPVGVADSNDQVIGSGVTQDIWRCDFVRHFCVRRGGIGIRSVDSQAVLMLRPCHHQPQGKCH